MEEKKVLNEEVLEKIAGGTEDGWQWYTKCCNKQIEIVWLPDEETKIAIKCTGCGRKLESETEMYYKE